MVGEFTDTEIDNNDMRTDYNPNAFYDGKFYSEFIMPENNDNKKSPSEFHIYGKHNVDCEGGKKAKCTFEGRLGGKKSRCRRSKKSYRKSRRGGKSRRGRR